MGVAHGRVYFREFGRGPHGGKEIYAGKKKIRPAGKSRKYPSTERRMIPQKSFKLFFYVFSSSLDVGYLKRRRGGKTGGSDVR